jgi:hypothetical protein
MGEFLAMSGVAGVVRTDVVRTLRDFASSKGGEMSPVPGESEPFEHLVVSGEDGSPVTVLYPSEFFGWDEASSYLSSSLHAPVFSMHIHDGDLWMYVLYHDGEEVDHFNPIPDYWMEDLSPEEESVWAGDAEVVARTWPGVDAASIERYLVTWDLDDDEPGKAYETDEHPTGDCWQLLDFMRKLGLPHPIDHQGRARGEGYRFEVSTDEVEEL